MLGLRYDTPEARDGARASPRRCATRPTTRRWSWRERGAFRCSTPTSTWRRQLRPSRLPQALKDRIRAHGIRNSHLLSIAPTGTISLAFADNASNGIEPPFSWTYTRARSDADGSLKEYAVEDHAWRLYRHLKGARRAAHAAFVTALEMSARRTPDGRGGRAYASTPAISKTVNVPADYPFADFRAPVPRGLGSRASRAWRPTGPTRCWLGAQHHRSKPRCRSTRRNRRLASTACRRWCSPPLRWLVGRAAGGNPAWTFMIEHPFGTSRSSSASCTTSDGAAALAARSRSGSTAPSSRARPGRDGQDAVDGHARQRPGPGCSSSSTRWPPWPRSGVRDAFRRTASAAVPGVVAATAAVMRWRCEQLGALTPRRGPTPVLDAMFSRDEPRTGPSGTLAWSVDIDNPATGELHADAQRKSRCPGRTAA